MSARKRAGASFVVAAMLGVWASAAMAADERPKADDQCVAKCDEQSDKCMVQAGKDGSKQRACDTAYDECLRKCG